MATIQLEDTLLNLYDQFHTICDTILEASKEKQPVYSTELEKEVGELTHQRVSSQIEEFRQRTEKLERLYSIVEVVLSLHYSGEFVSDVVTQLRISVESHSFSRMMSIYYRVKDSVVDHQIMKAVIAMFRINLGDLHYPYPDGKYSDRSIVKYATNCPECGDRAKQIINELVSAGMVL